jgi:MAF protein
MNIILGSSSKTRRKQLTNLGVEFTVMSPDIDETPLLHESAPELVIRLAMEKAQAVADKQHEPAVIIGADQVCVCDGEIIGKPHTRENAIKQLLRSSGKTLTFYTGLAVINTATLANDAVMAPTDVTFRELNHHEIESYVDKAKPLHCAGSFNIEGLGIVLFEKIISDDPSALLGLPLISLTTLLRRNGVSLI